MKFVKILKHNEYTLLKSKDNPIYKITANNQFDLGMLFLRHQEFYESPSAKFKNKKINIIEFVKWYVHEHDDCKSMFTYCEDYVGYNLPSTILEKSVQSISDYNIYDDDFKVLYDEILKTSQGQKFYLIGCLPKDIDTMQHEIAHAFFFLNPLYKKEMTILVNDMTKKEKFYIETYLKDGYSPKVFVDEIQAYISTGIPTELVNKISDKTIVKFEKTFFKYYNIF